MPSFDPDELKALLAECVGLVRDGIAANPRINAILQDIRTRMGVTPRIMVLCDVRAGVPDDAEPSIEAMSPADDSLPPLVDMDAELAAAADLGIGVADVEEIFSAFNRRHEVPSVSPQDGAYAVARAAVIACARRIHRAPERIRFKDFVEHPEKFLGLKISWQKGKRYDDTGAWMRYVFAVIDALPSDNATTNLLVLQELLKGLAGPDRAETEESPPSA